MGSIKSIKNWKVQIAARYSALLLLVLTIASLVVENTLTFSDKELNLKIVNQQFQYNVDLLSPQMLQSAYHETPVKQLNAAMASMQQGIPFSWKGENLPVAKVNSQLNASLQNVAQHWKAYQQAVGDDKKQDLMPLYQKLNQSAATYHEQLNRYFNSQQQIANILLGAIKALMLLTVALIFYVARQMLFNPLKKLYFKTKEMVLGHENTRAEENDSEVGKLARNINMLSQTIEHATAFTREIEKGNLEAEYQKNQDQEIVENSLSQSLTRMRDKMKESAKADKQRRWVTEGLAKFVDILRTDENGLEALSDRILSNLVKYLEANQGAIFIVEDEEKAQTELSLMAAYAFNRKKYITKSLKAGEGLVGQTYLEAETIYLTQVPESYVQITSGLGDANPRSILLVPMKINDKVMGVIEIASFRTYEPFEIEFVEKLGENIASTISNAKVNEKTRHLLEESQIMGEQLRAQEEEMRQNMEEMQATQEETQRKQEELQKAYEQMSFNEQELREKEANLNGILNSTEDSIASIDTNYRVIVANKVLQKRYEKSRYTCNKGDDILASMSEEVAREWKAYYDRALSGERFDFVLKSSVEGEDSYRHYYMNPIFDEFDKVVGASIVSRDVTEEKVNEIRIQNLLEDAQKDAEQLKHQEEMLKQQMQEVMEAQEDMKKVEKALRRKENNLNGIINNTDNSILMIDKDYKILIMNDTLKKRYKGTQYEYMDVDGNVLDMLDDSVRDEWVDYYERGFLGDKLDFTIKSTVKGEDTYRNYRINPVRNHKDEIYAITVISRDVTAQKVMELENMKLRKRD
jgi:PAS domain-containing protein